MERLGIERTAEIALELAWDGTLGKHKGIIDQPVSI